MKKTIKTHFKHFIFLLGISLLFVNCEKEEVEIINEYSEISNSNIKVQRITLEEIQQKQNLQKTIEAISKNFDINKNDEDKNASRLDSTDGSFTILTDEIIEVVTDSTTTYTFRIETPTSSSSTFENFVIDQPNDSLIKYYVYKYQYDETSEEHFPYTISFIEVDEELIDYSFFRTEDVYITCDWEETYDLDGNILSVELIDCWLSGGGGSGTGDNTGGDGDSDPTGDNSDDWSSGEDISGGGGGGSSTGNSGNDNNTGDNNSTTGVLNNNYEQEILDCLQSGTIISDRNSSSRVTSNYATWLSSIASINQLGALANYIKINGCSDETREFVINEIDTYITPYSVPILAQFSLELLTDECANNIIATEILLDLNSGLINSIRNIFNEDENVTLEFRNTDLVASNANAATELPSNIDINSGTYQISIGLSNTFLNNNPTKLSIALVTIHEMVHAKLIYHYLQGDLLTEYPEFTALNTALNVFIDSDRTDTDKIALNDAMHISMVNLLGTMSYSLYKYTQSVGMDTITAQYCSEITKGGFYNTPAMELIDTGSSTPEDLNNKYVNEQNNTPDALGDDCD